MTDRGPVPLFVTLGAGYALAVIATFGVFLGRTPYGLFMRRLAH